MNYHQLPLFIAVGLLITAVAVNVVPQPGLPYLERPKVSSDGAAAAIQLELDEIQNFDHYYGQRGERWRNNDPFIPWLARERERNRLDGEDEGGNKGQDLPSVPEQRERPKQPSRPSAPPLSVPELFVPIVVGLLEAPAATIARIRTASGEIELLHQGDSWSGWTFVGARPGGAVFADAVGVEHLFAVLIEDEVAATLPSTGASGGALAIVGSMISGGGDAAAILKRIEANQGGQRLLDARPDLRQVLGSNPAAARMAARQLGIDISDLDESSAGNR